jgi:predicted PurR-regulated permease PerM
MTVLLIPGAVFFLVNFTDNHVLQPVIYSGSIKSHPPEIFMAIIVGGGLSPKKPAAAKVNISLIFA